MAHRSYFVSAANAPAARIYAQECGAQLGRPGDVLSWFERVRVYAEGTTDAQIAAGTATVVGFIECGEVPDDLAEMFDLSGYVE